MLGLLRRHRESGADQKEQIPTPRERVWAQEALAVTEGRGDFTVWRLEAMVGVWCLRAVPWRSALGPEWEGKWGTGRSLEVGCREEAPRRPLTFWTGPGSSRWYEGAV